MLAGASLGGMNAQLFAARHPDEVAGVVLVDSLHPDLDAEDRAAARRRGARERRRALARNAEGVTYADLLASDDELRAARGLPARAADRAPARHLLRARRRAVPSIERLWGELQGTTRLSPEGRVVVAAQSHHRIAEDQPEVVVGAIREVVDAARGG